VIRIGERMCRAIEAAAVPAGQRGIVTISAGATAIDGRLGSKFNADDLIAEADKALYQAKELGRNRIIYSGRTLNAAKSQLALN
jgi:PleD family two-component response regulator